MSTFEAILLGIIQGLTEFFPVSSSGHLKLFQALFGFKQLNRFILFDLVCHLGTLLAILICYRYEIKALLGKSCTKLYQIILATLPLFPIALLSKPIKHAFDQPQLLAVFFLFTAALLYAGITLSRERSEAILAKNTYRDAVIIGIFQCIAIFPGISRSGSTISAARLLGWSKEQSISFSFLLAIPAILGGVAFEMISAMSKKAPTQIPSVSLWQYFMGFFFSFIIGYLALRWLINLASKGKLIYFVWYCLAVSLFSLVYFQFIY